jgi:hypothetical protein
MRRRGAPLLFPCMALLAACGSAASHDYELPGGQKSTPLLTVHGRITEVRDGVDDLRATRGALVWFPSSLRAQHDQVTQDLGPPFITHLLDLRIDVAHAPPPAAMEMGTGQAELIFYLDDGNGKLDVVEVGATSPDRVVGRAPDSLIVWGPARSTGSADAPRKPAGTGPRVCTREPPDYQVQCERSDEPGSSTPPPIPIHFSKEEVLSSYTCAGFRGSREWPDDTPGLSSALREQICNGCNGTAALASGDQNGCRVEILSGGWKACVDDPSLCGTTFCHAGTGRFVRGEWDCD